MSTKVSKKPAMRTALARAQTYALLARAFGRPDAWFEAGVAERCFGTAPAGQLPAPRDGVHGGPRVHASAAAGGRRRLLPRLRTTSRRRLPRAAGPHRDGAGGHAGADAEGK